MKRAAPSPQLVRVTRWLCLAAILMGLLWLFLPKPSGKQLAPSEPTVVLPPQTAPRQDRVPEAAGRAPLPGEKILSGYADPSQPPAQDLVLMHRCLDTFLLAAKGMKDQPLSANGEIAAALRGEGLVKVAFLPQGHPVFDEAGLLCDRWKTPLFFHAERAGVFAIRSAGPDKILWSADDLERQANGALKSGSAPGPR
jgi:hypothetical protein